MAAMIERYVLVRNIVIRSEGNPQMKSNEKSYVQTNLDLLKYVFSFERYRETPFKILNVSRYNKSADTKGVRKYSGTVHL